MVDADFEGDNYLDVREAVRLFGEKTGGDHSNMSQVIEAYDLLNRKLDNIAIEQKQVNKQLKDKQSAEEKLADAEKDLVKASAEGGHKKTEAERNRDLAKKHVLQTTDAWQAAKNHLDKVKKGYLKEGLEPLIKEMNIYHQQKQESLGQILGAIAAIDLSKYDEMGSNSRPSVAPSAETKNDQQLAITSGGSGGSVPQSV